MTIAAGRRPTFGFHVPHAITAILAGGLVALAGFGLVVLFDQNSSSPASRVEVVALPGGFEVELPTGWKASFLNDRVTEVMSADGMARVLFSLGPVDNLPLAPDLYDASDVYRVDDGSYVNVRMAAVSVLAFVVPAGDGLYYSGQAVVSAESPSLRPEAQRVAESLRSSRAS